MSEPVRPKETVILVHGTWAAPKPETKRWYQTVADLPDTQSFVTKLDAELAKHGSQARCWAHCAEGSDIFKWSGDNTWIERTRASTALAAYVNSLQDSGWRCHIVAHSHGGNIVAEALPTIHSKPVHPAGITGTVTTLGTPFIDAMTSVARLMDQRSKITSVIAWTFASLLVIFLLLIGFGAAIFITKDPTLIKLFDLKYPFYALAAGICFFCLLGNP